MFPERKLAAIMFTDIVGYTSLMGNDQQKALTILDINRRLQKPIIEEFNGRWIKELGDGVMASFNTVTDAVQAAINIQQKSNSTNDFQLRIGIHVGEVVFDNNDVFGDGVNIASRIQTAANPGSIFISGKVYDEIRNRKEIQAISAGKFSLRNVTDQMELFAIANPGIKIPQPGKIEKNEKCECILVLPFVNISNDPEQEFFSDGLTEEIIHSLSTLREMKIMSRTTSMHYKNTNKDLSTIAFETGATYIMEGSVRKHGDNIRITVKFIDALLDVQIWTETFNGTVEAIFDIQEKVAQKIVDALRMRLTKREQDNLKKRYTENTEAYQLYLKGRYFWKKRNGESLNSAVKLFESAIKLDPDYALAWAGLADTYSLLGEYSNNSRRELLPKVISSVNKALELDDQLAEAHISLAISHMLNEWDWKNSEKEFRIGISLNPNYATGHHWYAEMLLFQERIVEAFNEISFALELDPVSPGILKDKGIFYYYNRQYDQAIDMATKTLELDKEFLTAHRLSSLAYTALGMYDKAIEENNKWEKLSGNTPKATVALAHIYATAGDIKKVNAILKETAHVKLGGNDYRGMALVFSALGDNDKTFEWLGKSFSKHEESLCSIRIDPKWDPVRDDPRFNQLLSRIGLLA